MGVYIKGIEIPNDNFVTVVAIYRNPKTERIYAEWTDELGIHHGIKPVEISIPHGRLIDADALFQDLTEHNIPFNNDINSAINVAPTILEDEEL